MRHLLAFTAGPGIFLLIAIFTLAATWAFTRPSDICDRDYQRTRDALRRVGEK